MLVSENPEPSLGEFSDLMWRTDLFLNDDAKERPEYYAKRNGQALEDDVKYALDEVAKGTPFEGSIVKISGQKFPDIVAAKLYGVEVKSTDKDKWTSTGSSIMESTRVADVERIYLTFGKLGGDRILFHSRPYEECLSGIAVTHSPRYLIDMKLKKGETIFDKMGISYDELRLKDNPIDPVSKYYRSQLKDGESLWWVGDSSEETASVTLRTWDVVSSGEQNELKSYGLVTYPEVFSGNFKNYALWLTTSNSVVDYHIRDEFTSGGRKDFRFSNGRTEDLPGIYQRVQDNRKTIASIIFQKCDPNSKESTLSPNSKLGESLLDWCEEASRNAARHPKSPVRYDLSMDVLYDIFFVQPLAQRNSNLKACRHCRYPYIQVAEARNDLPDMVAEDTCPYCGYENGSSARKKYYNRAY